MKEFKVFPVSPNANQVTATRFLEWLYFIRGGNLWSEPEVRAFTFLGPRGNGIYRLDESDYLICQIMYKNHNGEIFETESEAIVSAAIHADVIIIEKQYHVYTGELHLI